MAIYRGKGVNRKKIAENNVQSDWNETNNSSSAYIKNKPSNITGDGISEVWIGTEEPPEGYTLWINPEDEDDLTNIDSVFQTIMDKSHPIGSYYWSDDSTDPYEVFGIGTWQRVTDTFMYAISDNETPGVKKTTSTMSLTIANIPSHTHIQNEHTHRLWYSQSGYGVTIPGNCHYIDNTVNTSSSLFKWLANGSTISNVNTMSVNTNATAINQNTGSGTAFDIMPPHRGAYCWKRIL